MTALVRRWQASADTQAAFAMRHGLTRAKLQYWVRRVALATGESIAFTPVKVVPGADAEPGAMDVVLASGERLVLRDGVSADLIRTVLTALRPPC
jgi:hypothetical protein